MRLLRWKFILPLVGLAFALAAGRMVADLSTPDAPPDDPVAAGFALFADHRYTPAEVKFEQARSLDPDNGEAYAGLALVALERDRDVARADELFRKAISLPGTSPVAFANYGRFLIAEKRYDEAVNVLEKGAARDPDYVPVRARLAIAQYAAGQADAACRTARSLGDDVPDAEEGLIDKIRKSPGCATR